MPLDRRHFLAVGLAGLLGLAHPAQAQRPRWVEGDPAPPVEGLHLGDSRETVVRVLGDPDPSPLPPDPTADIQSLRYRGGALMVLLRKGEGVVRVMLMRPEGGSIDGIKVGDPLSPMLKSWGEPTVSTSTTGRYIMGNWMIAVRADLGEQRILRLMLGRPQPLQPQPQPPAPLPAWATATPDPASTQPGTATTPPPATAP